MSAHHSAPRRRQKPHILSPFDRLAFPELFRSGGILDHLRGFAPGPKRETAMSICMPAKAGHRDAKFSTPQPPLYARSARIIPKLKAHAKEDAIMALDQDLDAPRPKPASMPHGKDAGLQAGPCLAARKPSPS